ncbi:MAG: alpha/beta hydrolase [Solirubrobacterales bacterium]
MAEWSEERFADAGRGIELCYQTVGDPGAAPMLLVMGIGSQMVNWPDGFCERLAARDFFVIRFDNRDSGRSTWLPEFGTPSVSEAFNKQLDHPPYLFTDMADDCVGLLDALGIAAAHVVGASLGGFVAQTLAIEHPERVLSLASVMSSTGSGEVGQPHPQALEVLMTRPPDDLEGYVENLLAGRRVIGSSGIEQDEDLIRDTAKRAYNRGINPEGTQRQLVASICSGSRHARLGEIEAPTVVLHGSADTLIDPSGGRATAEAIPGAELVVIDGWGHDLPPAVWERVVDAITANAKLTQEVRA